VFPADNEARTAIDVERRLHCGCTSEEYLRALTSALCEADECGETPDLVIHNAGTDILDQDPLGR
jgi:acetoin utilization deacetylase AcuC-like enzyme